MKRAARGLFPRAYSDEGFAALSDAWVKAGWERKFSYQFSWQGRPVIQMPEDLLKIQEAIWEAKPDVVVETGTAHGGSAVFYASLLLLRGLRPGKGKVISVDVDLRAHNRAALDAHPLRRYLHFVAGDSAAAATVRAVRREIPRGARVLVALDAKHTKAHVRAELERYAPLVSVGSYLVVFDGVMRLVADTPRGQRSWRRDNPLAATREFLRRHPEFQVDPRFPVPHVTYAPGGFLRKVRAR